MSVTQFGLKKESTWATAVTPDRFFEIAEGGGLQSKIDTTIAGGYRAGQVVPSSSRQIVTKKDNTGDIEVAACTIGLGMLLNAFFGAVTGPTTATGGTTTKQQVHTLKTTDPMPSYTLQQGIQQVGTGTTDPYTFEGAMCSSLDVSAKVGEDVTIKLGWVAKHLNRATALTTASYPAALELFSFVGVGLAIGSGTPTAATSSALASTTSTALVNVQEVNLSLKRGLVDRFNLGTAGERSAISVLAGADPDTITGDFTAEYTSSTFVDAYLNQTQLDLLLTFQGPSLIEGSLYPVLQFAIPCIKLTSDTPLGKDGDIVTVKHSFRGLVPAAGGEPIQCVYRSVDTAL